MANIRELYESKHGSRLSIVLRSLGGDPNQIKAYWQDRLDHPTDNDLQCQREFKWPALDADSAVDAAHNQIVREIERLYFAGTPRDVAVMLSNALLRTAIGTFAIVPSERDLTYTVYTFYRTWNSHNPDADQIVYNDLGI